MFINVFGRQWIKPNHLTTLKTLPDQFSAFMVTHQNRLIPIASVTGNERWVKAIVVEFMDGRKTKSFMIDGPNELDMASHIIEINEFVADYGIKNQPKKRDLQTMQSAAVNSTEKTLGIYNDIEALPRQLTFHLNDYTTEERERIIAYLNSVDDKSVDVVVNLDFSRCSKEQLERNDDFLMFAKAMTSTND